MADETVVTFTADTSGLDSAIAQITSSMSSLQTAAQSAGSGLGVVETHSAGAGTALKETAESGGILSEALEQLGTHTRTVGMGLGAMGLGAQEATEKVVGLTEALVAMQTAVPGLLAIAAALAVVAGAVAFVADGVKDASAMQSYMETLGAAVNAQGGDWEANEAQVESWLTTVSNASGVLKSELIPALNTLVTAGNDVHDSQIIEQAAVDLSTAKHISLATATNTLIQAEDGHDTRLVKLVGSVQKVIDVHGNYQSVLDAVVKSTQDSVTKNDSLAIAHGRLVVQISAVAEVLGDKLIPFLTGMMYEVMGGITAVEELGEGFKDFFGAIVEDVEAGTSALGEFMKALALLAQGNVAGAGQMVQSGLNIGAAHLKAADALNDKARHNIGHGMTDDMGDTGRRNSASAVAGYEALNTELDNPNGNPAQKKAKKAKAAGADYNPSEVSENPEDDDALAKAKAAVTAAITDETAAQKAYTDVVNVGLDSVAVGIKKQTDAYALYVKNEAAISSLTATIKQNSADVAQDEASYKLVNEAYEASTQKLQALQNSLRGKTNISVADKNAVKDATDEQKRYGDALGIVDKNLKDETEILTKHEAQLTKTAAAVTAYIAGQQKLASSILNSSEKEQQKLANDVATHGRSEAELLAYYSKQYDAARAAEQADFNAHHSYNEKLVADENATLDQMYQAAITAYNKDYDAVQAATKKITDLKAAALNTQEDDALKAQQEANKDLTSFLDGVLTKSNNFGAAFQQLWKTVENNYIKQFEQMLLPAGGGASTGLASFMGISSSPSAGQNNTQAVQMKAATDALAKASTTLTTDESTISSKFGVNAQAFTTNAQQFTQAATALTSAATAIKSMGSGSGAVGTPMNITGIAGQPVSSTSPLAQSASTTAIDDPFYGSLGSSTPGFIDPSHSAAITAAANASTPTVSGTQSINLDSFAGTKVSVSSLLGKAATGVAEGGMIASLDGGNQQWASLLGGVGGLFGPVAGAAGGLLGSFLGPNWGPPTNYPDRSNTAIYGQDLANWNGTSGANINGTIFNAQESDLTAAGNQSESQQMEQFVIDNKNNTTNLTQQQQDFYTQMETLMGGTSMVDLGIASEHNGVFTYGNGKTQNVTDAEALQSTFEAMQGGSGSNTPIYSLNRLAPNFNQTTMASWGTDSTNALGNQTFTQTAQQPVQTVTVNVTIPNGVVGMTPAELGTLIQQQIHNNQFYNNGNTASQVY